MAQPRRRPESLVNASDARFAFAPCSTPENGLLLFAGTPISLCVGSVLHAPPGPLYRPFRPPGPVALVARMVHAAHARLRFVA